MHIFHIFRSQAGFEAAVSKRTQARRMKRPTLVSKGFELPRVTCFSGWSGMHALTCAVKRAARAATSSSSSSGTPLPPLLLLL